MSKKLLIYGLAFGSASAALSYIYMTSAVYKSSGPVHLFSILAEFLIIPGIGIYMFLKAYRNEGAEQYTVGRAVFMGFFLSIIISAAVSLVYSYIHQFKPQFIAQIIDYKTHSYANGKSALSIRDTSVAAYQKDVAAYTKYQQEQVYTMSKQFVSQLFSGASRGLFLGAIFGYLLRPKTTRKD